MIKPLSFFGFLILALTVFASLQAAEELQEHQYTVTQDLFKLLPEKSTAASKTNLISCS